MVKVECQVSLGYCEHSNKRILEWRLLESGPLEQQCQSKKQQLLIQAGYVEQLMQHQLPEAMRPLALQLLFKQVFYSQEKAYA
jgi:hypothetical protein